MEILKEIKTNGYVILPMNISKELCEEVLTTYREFDNTTSLEDKEKTTYSIQPNSPIEFGYEDRRKEKGFDNKSYFHFNSDLLKKNILSSNLNYNLFLEKAQILFSQIQLEVKKILMKISKETNLDLKKLLNSDDTPSLNMRIVNYKPTSQCKTLAKPHFDWCIMTFAIYETQRGLNFLHNNKIIPITYKEHQAKLFPGKSWSKYILPHVKPLEHEVLNTGKNTQRSAIVIFVNPKIY